MTLPLSDVLLEPDLFAPWFLNPETFKTWFTIVRAIEGLPLDDEQLEIFTELTGQTEAPTAPSKEVWIIAGRRSAKTLHMAIFAVWKATSFDWSSSGLLAPGERAVASIAAATKGQAIIAMRYVSALVNDIPHLAKMKTRETAEGFEFSNGSAIEVQTANYRAVRGRTYCFFGVDEAAFLRDDESANPDSEVYAAAMPGLATLSSGPNPSLFWGSSSPWAKRGLVYKKFSDNWGKSGDPLVFKGTTQFFNPTITDEYVARQVADDPARAQSEWFGEFRRDIDAFISREVVESCVSRGVFERQPVSGKRYFAFVDPSGGSKDAMTLAIAHQDDDRVILDSVRERKPPFSPEAVVADFCETLKTYGLHSVTGDRYAGEWPREQFRKHGVSYRLADKTRSDLYLALLPALNSQSVDLLDTERTKLVNQIVGLERRTARSGKESIDHAPNSHDDLANAVAGVVAELTTKRTAATVLVGRYGISNQHHPLVGRYGIN